MARVLIQKLSPDVELPDYKTSGASGVDLMAFVEEPIKISPNSSYLVPTGLSMAFSEDYEVQIRPRSGLAAKKGITVLNTPGTIDSDYRGEIKIILFNHGKEDFIINNKDRVAQMILTPVIKMEFEETDNLPDSLRPKLVIGFAAETNDIQKNAKKKLLEKNCDWIIANDISNESIGFDSDFNEVSIFYKNEKIKDEKLIIKKKTEISDEIINRVIKQLN
jgi:dUTP pyrophosphatase